MLITVEQFRELALEKMPSLVRKLQDETGRSGEEETEAWSKSLPKLAEILSDADLGGFHLHLTPKSGSLSLEYRLPAASNWCDAVLLGGGPERPAAVIIELKHWDIRGDTPGPRPALINHNGATTLHPSDQVRGYVEYCQRFHGAVHDFDAAVSGCTLFTHVGNSQAYEQFPHDSLVREFPVFTADPKSAKGPFAAFLRGRLKEPDESFAVAFERGRYRQDRGFVKAIAAAIISSSEPPFVLLDGQRLGLERCLGVLEGKLAADSDAKSVIVVEGPPGSGKSVIAARVWAAAAADARIPDAGNVVFVTTSGSQKTNWRSLFDATAMSNAARGVVRTANEFNPGLTPKWVKEQQDKGRTVSIATWRDNLRLYSQIGRAPRIDDNEITLSVVDEAHALINSPVPEAKGVAPGGWTHHAGPQAWHLIRSSKTTIFFLDSAQSFRDNETTSVAAIRSFAVEHGAEFIGPIRLDGAQFRCAGSKEYVDWLDRLLADETAASPPPRMRTAKAQQFNLTIVANPRELEERLRSHVLDGSTARLLATYGREWKTKIVSNPHALPPTDMDFNLRFVADGKIQQWSRIWNYAPEQDYSLFVQAPEGSAMALDPLCEVGCPYVVRGFDWDYVGLLWLSDLVRRGDQWVVQLDHDFETSWRNTKAAAKKEVRAGVAGPANAKLLRQMLRGYRILLTRALKGAYVWCEDPETERWLRRALIATQPKAISATSRGSEN